jgi:hypothetical protein
MLLPLPLPLPEQRPPSLKLLSPRRLAEVQAAAAAAAAAAAHPTWQDAPSAQQEHLRLRPLPAA